MKFIAPKIFYLFILIAVLFVACKSDDELNIVYPEGGYQYLKNISSRDSNNYYLPIRHSLPTRDRFLGVQAKYYYQGFNEENLSLHPPKEDIFRFRFECGYCGKAAIVTLTQNKIILKKSNKGYSGVSIEDSLLSKIERYHYNIIDRYYPFNDPKLSIRYRYFFDSLINVHPELMDQGYFEKLRTKASVIHNIPLEYTTERIFIPVEKFKYFVNLINTSEFWKRSYSEECSETPTDGDGFSLEVATKYKYHHVTSNYCLDEKSPSKFKQATDELLKFIGLDLNAFYLEGFWKDP